MEKRYFPLFTDISGQKIVVVGGGTIAARRVRTLSFFAGDITVAAPGLDPELAENPIMFPDDSVLAKCETYAGLPEDTLLESITLREAVGHLPEREQKVIALRYFRQLTQEQTARILGVSQVQISRIEKKALTSLRAELC